MNSQDQGSVNGNHPNQRKTRGWGGLIVAGCVIVLLVGVLAPKVTRKSAEAVTTGAASAQPRTGNYGPSGTPKSSISAQQIVATKVSQFARDRLRITRAMAKGNHFELPTEVGQFFEAAAGGRWEQLNDLYRKLQRLRDGPIGEQLAKVWGPILETQLIAECAHSWPAQKLLDYGQATLGSLAPGMVYIGGTDPGRGIPTLLNETSGGDQHIVITQNGLADGSYLEYLRFLYGDQLSLPTTEQTAQTFNDYLKDAQARFEHDRQFPEQPKQVHSGEEIQYVSDSGLGDSNTTDRKIQVSGQVAVMAINERILQSIMDQNPGMSFALEESFPLLSTYPSAEPLGPIMQLRAPDVQSTFTTQSAANALDYWRSTSEELATDPEAPEGSDVRKTYSKMAASQANLLAEHNFETEAEQTYRLAMEMEPSSPEAVYGLANLLAKNGRLDEARQLADTFKRSHPDQATLPMTFFISTDQ
jgi:hypothetical protein